MGRKMKEQTRAKFTEEQIAELCELGSKGYTAEGLQRHINMIFPSMNISLSQFYGAAKRHNIPYRRIKGNAEPVSKDVTEPVEVKPEEPVVVATRKTKMVYTDEMLNYLRGFRHSGLNRIAITKLFNSKFPDANVTAKQITDKIYHMHIDIEKPQSYTKADQISIDELPKEPTVKFNEKLNILVEQPSFNKFRVTCKIKQNKFFYIKWEKIYVAHCDKDALKAANADLSALLEQNTKISITKRVVEKM